MRPSRWKPVGRRTGQEPGEADDDVDVLDEIDEVVEETRRSSSWS